MLVDLEGESRLVIWDWKTARVLFDLEAGGYLSVEFIDDDRLLGCLNPTSMEPQSLVVLDTRKSVGGFPLKTLFHFPSFGGNFAYPPLLLEHGAHKPSPEESQAPFYRDPAQRIVALCLGRYDGTPIFRIGALLELLEDREGSEIEWDDWKSHVVIPSLDPDCESPPCIWVSGCRLFSVDSVDAQMEVYDSSMQGCMEYLSDEASYELGGLRHLSSTGTEVRVPRGGDGLVGGNNGHDGVIFPYLPDSSDDFEFGQLRLTLHIWTF